jgi:hypothetical protein
MEDLHNTMRRVSALRKDEESDRQKRLAKRSKDKLAQIVEKKFKTTFIGALSCFEELFGFLWGQGKPENQLTEREKEMYDRWQQCRTKILNNGNNQARAVLNELQQYMINWQGYSMNLQVRG